MIFGRIGRILSKDCKGFSSIISMRILYITRANLSFSRAHTQNILKTVEVLRKHGDVVEFIAEKNELRLFMAVGKKRTVYDVLYFRDPYLWWVALFARFVLRKKVVFEVHGSHEWRMGAPFWRAALLVSTSAVFITNKLAEYYRYRKPFVVTHTSGVDIDSFNVSSEILNNVRVSSGLSVGVPVLLYAGSFLWYDIHALVEMMPQLKHQAQLVIVGAKAHEEQELLTLAKSLGVSDRVHIVGRVTPALLPPYLLLADILLNPLKISYPSSISSKLYEYLATGKAIISTKGGANDEVIDNGRNGVLLDSTDSAVFARAVDDLLGDLLKVRQLGDTAKLDSQRYTWDARAKSIKTLL
ncbi:MAG: glycosyltransferase [Candidatus Ryanbacteria bacterium]|nr:glycosyltransferase [Candidatus Ryanbacteria bacterium]